MNLKGTRIGLVGDPSDWLVASRPAPEVIEEKWGATIVPIGMGDLRLEMKALEKEDIKQSIAGFVEKADITLEPASHDLDNVGAVFLALKSLIKSYHLDALTIRCFDLVVDNRTTGCFALSQLLDEGLVAACEGDLVSTIGMLLAQKTTGETPWMANPAMIDVKENKLVLAHCTVPRSLVGSYSIRSHFESGLGVGIQGFMGNGPVTIFRLGGKKLEKFWVAEGDIISAGNSEMLCRTQAEIRLNDEPVKDILERPLGNHLVMVKGHHKKSIMSLLGARLADSIKGVDQS